MTATDRSTTRVSGLICVTDTVIPYIQDNIRPCRFHSTALEFVTVNKRHNSYYTLQRLSTSSSA